MKIHIGKWMLLVAMLISGSAAYAQTGTPQGCNLQTLKGSYAVRVQGAAKNLNNGTQAFTFWVGVMAFDGAGGIQGWMTQNFDGFVSSSKGKPAPPGTGLNYTMDADCTGQIILTDGPNKTFWDVVVADNGKMFVGVVATTIPGFTSAMEGNKQ